MNKCAAIVVLVYDRLQHLKQCIEALKKNELAKESKLYVISDAPFKEEHRERIEAVRSFIKGIDGFLSVEGLFWEKNKGSHKSSGDGISYVLKTNDSFIFLEDDIVVSSDFLSYMNEGLRYYQKDPHIFSICGFSHPFKIPRDYTEDVYFHPCNSPWGFATWKDRWVNVNRLYLDRYSELKKNPKRLKEFLSVGFYIKGILIADSQKQIEAGDLRLYYHMFQNRMCSVFPVISKTQNWGFDGTGEHCGNKKVLWAKPMFQKCVKPTKFIPFEGYNKQILINHRKFQDKINGGFLAKWLKYTWLHNMWKKLRKSIIQ